MPIYLQRSPDYEGVFVWRVDDAMAVRVGVPNPTEANYSAYATKGGKDFWHFVQTTKYLFPNGEKDFHLATLQPGQHYHRIARPGSNQLSPRNLVSPCARELQDAVAVAKSQLAVLTRQLHEICQTVHPSGANLEVHGHQIRNLLILACTEVESHWKAVLAANGYARERYSTNDYVKLEPAMKLGGYGVSFIEYPWLKPFYPFAAWGLTGSPTKELRWFDSYNDVKHDREKHFARATLKNAFDAVAASAVMVAAQFGFRDSFNKNLAGDSVHFTAFPTWSPVDVYIHHHGDEGRIWCPVSYDFEAPAAASTAGGGSV